MDYLSLIPRPETIPAPWGIFEILNILTFLLHIILVNVVVGSAIIALMRKASSISLENSLYGPTAGNTPTMLALAINLGVAPLLFVQVVYGHFLYTSSVLMAVYWILVIPFLIVAYYGTYIFTKKIQSSPGLATVSLWVAVLIFLYIGFVYVNNMTLMVQPQNWTAYFENRGGTLLNVTGELWPRYLHFVVASIAIGGLASSLFWKFKKADDSSLQAKHIKSGLTIFAIATAVQIGIGFWWLIALPKPIMMNFMGQNMVMTILLVAGMLLAIGALVMGFLGKLWGTVGHLLATMIVMVLMRAMLRSSYLKEFFTQSSLELKPQYDVFALFLVIFIAGLGIVYWMVKSSLKTDNGRGA